MQCNIWRIWWNKLSCKNTLRNHAAATAISNSTLFQDVEDEFLHDDSFAEAEEATKQSATQIEEDNNDDSAIESEKVTVDSKHQISSG